MARSLGREFLPPRFESGRYFGEREFLGLADKRDLTVMAATFCEVQGVGQDASRPHAAGLCPRFELSAGFQSGHKPSEP